MAKPMPQLVPLSIPEYGLRASGSNQFDRDAIDFQQLKFGYFGEIGGLLSAVKKVRRDNLATTVTELAAEELGDALWYLINIAATVDVEHDQIGERCIAILRSRNGENDQDPVIPVTFRHIDSLMEIRRSPGSIDRSVQLGTLANHAGSMAEMTFQNYTSMPPHSRSDNLGMHLAELSIVCASFNLRLEDVARANLEKIHSRWPEDDTVYPPAFDGDAPEHEQFPAELAMEFIERGTPANGYVVQSLRGVFIGDRLTDNSNEPDDYRFHDVFHLAYVAYLGWSPVFRALLKRKRKSDAKKDENEDGARAMIIEEGIATWIFNHAKGHNFYVGANPGALDYGVLKQIKSMVEGYEVEKCRLWQWEKAILAGFGIFRELQTHRGGTVIVDVRAHTMRFEPPAKNEQQ